MPTSNEKNTTSTSTTFTPDQVLEAARDWGRMHGKVISTCDDIHAAVRAGEPVDWLEDTDMLWDGLTVYADPDDLEQLDPELREEAEEVAEEAAREEGERLCRTMTIAEIEAMIGSENDGQGGDE